MTNYLSTDDNPVYESQGPPNLFSKYREILLNSCFVISTLFPLNFLKAKHYFFYFLSRQTAEMSIIILLKNTIK